MPTRIRCRCTACITYNCFKHAQVEESSCFPREDVLFVFVVWRAGIRLVKPRSLVKCWPLTTMCPQDLCLLFSRIFQTSSNVYLQPFVDELQRIDQMDQVAGRKTHKTPTPARQTPEYCRFRYAEDIRPPPHWTQFTSRYTVKEWVVRSKGSTKNVVQCFVTKMFCYENPALSVWHNFE